MKESILNVYQKFNNLSDILSFVNSKSVIKSRFRAHFVSFFSENNPIELITKKLINTKVFVKDNINIIYVPETRVHDPETNKQYISIPEGCLILFRKGIIWNMFSLDSSRFIEERLEKIFNTISRKVTPLYLSTNDIYEILKTIKHDLPKSEIFSIKSVMYSYSNKARIDFGKYPYEDIFSEIKERRGYISSIKFDLEDKDKKILLTSRISRACRFDFYLGDVNIFLTELLNNVSKILENKVKLFKENYRIKYFEDVSPFIVNYKYPVFKNINDNIVLASKLSKLPKTNLTIYHNNPYFHGTLLDFYDGSAFDIYVASQNTVRIIPRPNATISSLSKLWNTIFEGISESEIQKEPEFAGSFDKMLNGEL